MNSPEQVQTHAENTASTAPHHATACLVLADGTIFKGRGFGATGETRAELVFHTAMGGYQEIITDPAYAGQVVCFTLPHIGVAGLCPQDNQSDAQAAAGIVVHWDPAAPSNWRSTLDLAQWMQQTGRIGLGGVDTRKLTRAIRDQGTMRGVLAHDPQGNFDTDAMLVRAREWDGLAGRDLAGEVSCKQPYRWAEGVWGWPDGFAQPAQGNLHVVVVDYGVRRDVLRALAQAGVKVTVVPAKTSAADILGLAPDGVFLSNGPGDPAVTGEYAVPMIKALLERELPIFGAGLGHLLLARTLGAKTVKLHHGHHGANHPVQDVETRKVEITSVNQSFAVDAETLPDSVKQTHVSLFDNSNFGLQVNGKPVFSVQYCPDTSLDQPDGMNLFDRFARMLQSERVA